MIDDIDEKKLAHMLEEKLDNTEDVRPYTWSEIIGNLNLPVAVPLFIFHLGFVAWWIISGLGLTTPVKWFTICWVIIIGYGTAVGVTAGAHRLWAHRAYKANLPFRIILMLIYSVVGMNPIYNWVRDHRIHHKYSETDADPHNARRGFFFSHIGWLLMKRHPEFKRRCKEIDLTDITSDPVVMFNKKYAVQLLLILCFTLPTAIPILFFDETVMNAIFLMCFVRYVLVLHSIWCVNSVAHLWGDRPYNRLINPVQSPFVSFLTAGEGSHNYHHTFPWDYKAAELPYICFNTTTLFIDAFAKIGWAYDLREPSPEFVDKVVQCFGYKSETVFSGKKRR